MSAPIDPNRPEIPANEITPKMSFKQLGTTIAATATALGLGGAGGLNGLEYTIVSDTQIAAYEDRIAELNADKAIILAQMEEREAALAAAAESDISRCLSVQRALRGMNCQLLRQSGALSASDSCWGQDQ